MYNNFIKIKEFRDSLQISSYRLIDSTVSFNPGSSYVSDSDNILRISRSRSFSLLRDYIKSNHFEYFVTLTLKDPIRYDTSSACALFNDSISLYGKYSRRYAARHPTAPQGPETLGALKSTRAFHRAPCVSGLRREKREAFLSSNERRCVRLGRVSSPGPKCRALVTNRRGI